MKSAEYFDADLEWSNEEKIVGSNVVCVFLIIESNCIYKGNKYKLVDNWGEQLFEAKQPVLCIMDTPSGNVTVLEDIDSTLSPCQVKRQ